MSQPGSGGNTPARGGSPAPGGRKRQASASIVAPQARRASPASIPATSSSYYQSSGRVTSSYPNTPPPSSPPAPHTELYYQSSGRVTSSYPNTPPPSSPPAPHETGPSGTAASSHLRTFYTTCVDGLYPGHTLHMTDLALVLLTTPGINYGGSLNSQDEFDAWLGETLAVYTQGLQGSGPVQVPDVAEMAQSLLDQIGGCTGQKPEAKMSLIDAQQPVIVQYLPSLDLPGTHGHETLYAIRFWPGAYLDEVCMDLLQATTNNPRRTDDWVPVNRPREMQLHTLLPTHFRHCNPHLGPDGILLTLEQHMDCPPQDLKAGEEKWILKEGLYCGILWGNSEAVIATFRVPWKAVPEHDPMPVDTTCRDLDTWIEVPNLATE